MYNAKSMVIRVVSSKIDQFQKVSVLVKAHTGEVTYPVRMMEKYFQLL